MSLVEWMSPKLPKDKPCHLLGIGSAFVRTVALLRNTHFSFVCGAQAIWKASAIAWPSVSTPLTPPTPLGMPYTARMRTHARTRAHPPTHGRIAFLV